MRKLAAWAALSVVAVVLVPVIIAAAFAQDAGEPSRISGPGIWTVFAEPIAIVLGAAVTVALGWLTPRLAGLLGQDKANKLQAALQAAADRAAGIAILKLSGRAYSLTGPLPAADTKIAIDEGVAYLKKTMPGTIAKLGAGDEALRRIVEANLGLKIAGK